MKIIITEKKDKVCTYNTSDVSLLVPIAPVLAVLHSLSVQRDTTIFIDIYLKPMYGVFVKGLLCSVVPIKL